MKATHIGYKHPRHLRVEDGDQVLCVAPSYSDYAKLARGDLPVWPERSRSLPPPSKV